MLSLFYSLLAVITISFVAIVALYYLIKLLPSIQKFTSYFVGIAVGGLLGDAYFHILPEAYEIFDGTTVGILTIAGIIIFFSIEKIVRWRHCHDPECHDSTDHIVPISLTGEIIHNLIDGIVIAGSFLVSLPIGIATTLAVLIHEIPQEMGDFAIYLHQGRSLAQALRLNLISASFSLVGVILTFIIGTNVQNFSEYVLPITAGGFIYLAASDLIPELHRHHSDTASSLLQIILVLLGTLLMAALLLLE